MAGTFSLFLEPRNKIVFKMQTVAAHNIRLAYHLIVSFFLFQMVSVVDYKIG